MKNLISFIITLFILINFFYTVKIFSQEETGDSSAFRSSVWFYTQRAAPNSTIPDNAYGDAITQKNSMSPSGPYLNVTWSNIGPVSIPFDNTYCAGRITTCSFTSDNHLFIGAAEGGVWKTSLSSLNWTDISAGLTSFSSGSVAVSSLGDTIYYGSGESITGYFYTYSYLAQGIFKSINGGSNWSNYHLSSPDPVIYKLAINPADNTILLAATSLGIFRSTNAGINWSVISNTRGLAATDITYTPVNGDTAYAVGYSSNSGGIGYLMSTDAGSTFYTPNNNRLSCQGRTAISICQNYDNNIYAVTEIYPNVQVYLSTNAGNTFSTTSQANNNCGQLGFDLTIAVKPDDPSIVFLGAVLLEKSTDFGGSFTDIGGYNVHSDIHELVFKPGYPNTLVAVSDGGAFLSTDCGDSWSNINNGLPLAQIYRIGSTPRIYLFRSAGFWHRLSCGKWRSVDSAVQG